MKKIIAAFLLLTSACFGQTIASRRYAEKTPLQLTFGSFTPVVPYNEADGYTLVPDAQIQPANGVLNNNQCASTSDFTVIQNTDSPTFTAASGVCTVTTGSGSGQTFKIGSTASSFSAPDVFVEVPITQNGSGGGTDIIGAGLYKADGTVELEAQVNIGSNSATVTVDVNGSFTDLCSAGLTIPAAPWTLGFSLVGAQGAAWYNTGTGWQMLCTADFSSRYDPRIAGLSGFQAGVKVFTSVATTWKFSSVKSGLFGGTGVRDISAVVYPDGRPYMHGSVAYFLATLGGVSGSAVDSPNGVFSYDLVSGALTFLGNIASNRNSGIFEDSAGQIIYDPATNTERLFISTWGTPGTTPVIAYASQSISMDDWLAVGVHTSPAMTMMTIPGSTYTYDPNVNCVNWNYSSSTCGKWLMAASSASGALFGEPLLLSSTADPSANSWASIMADSANEGYEGSRLIRTPTTYLGSGVAYTGCFAGVVGSATRSSRCYDMAGTYLGALNVTWPPALGSDNPPHATVIEYGGKAYLVTFNDNSFKTISQTMGNWIVATAPEY